MDATHLPIDQASASETTAADETPLALDQEIVASDVDWKWYIVGLVGLAMGGGFYSILCGILLVAWGSKAPNAPTVAEGAAMACAAAIHLAPLALWLIYRQWLLRTSVRAIRSLAIAAWLLVPATLVLMFWLLGM